mgnify:FL=1
MEFNDDFINQNTNLFLMSIQEAAHKFYVNWMDILPISLSEYQTTELFDNTTNLIRNNKLRELNVVDDTETTDDNLEYFHSIHRQFH